MSSTPSSLHMVPYRLDREILLTCEGWMRLDNCQSMREQVCELMIAPIEAFHLDLRGLHELDSAGLGVLVGLHMTARKRQIMLLLLSPNPPQMKLMTTTRLDTIFEIAHGPAADAVRERLLRDELIVAMPGETQF